MTFLINLSLFAAIIGIAYSVGIYEQCAGDGYGNFPCDAGLTCFRRNTVYSNCQYNCPRNQGWECEYGLPAVPVATVAIGWDQCGGDGWYGARACEAGYACYARSAFYSQCRPVGDCPAGWTCYGWVSSTYAPTYAPTIPATVATVATPATPVVLPIYSRCNDVGYAVCAPGTGCFRNNANYAECRPYCPATWACETDVIAADEQCGGQDYVGVTRCAEGLNCYARSKWYSFCAASCPGVDWAC